MIDIGWSRQADKLREMIYTLPKGLGDRKTAFGLAMLDSRGPFPKLFQVWRLWHFLAVFQAFAASRSPHNCINKFYYYITIVHYVY